MSAPDGITGPASVPEGHTGTIQVHAAGCKELRVVVSESGDAFDVAVDDQGIARFELPASATAGTTLLICDNRRPELSTTIEVTPASQN